MVKQFRIAKSFPSKLEEAGLSVPAILRAAGLPRDFFTQSRVMVTTGELFALWEAIGRTSKDPAIGLKLGTETLPERFHPIGIAGLAAPNFGASVEQMARFKKLTAPEEILQEKADDEWRIRFHWTCAVDTEPAVLIEHCFAWLLTIARHGTGTLISPLRVELARPRSHGKVLERYFGCQVLCGMSQNAIVFHASQAAVPFVTDNAELLELLVPQLEKELQQHPTEDGESSFVELVRGTIQQNLTGRRPTIESIADHLHMSPRTLQRRLQESGARFQHVLDEARHRLARYYLGNSDLELNEAAYLLGFGDANSFARAFRGWEGEAPGRWRANRTLAAGH